MFKSIKKAFGFSDHDDDELIQDDPDFSSGDSPSATVSITAEQPSVADVDLLSEQIFKHVVQEFNKSLPGFLQAGVDGERQQKYLYDTLNSDVKAHLSNLEQHVMRQLEESWQSERNRLQGELKQLEQNAREIESKRADIKEKQLSAERQRRALSDRVRDLEKQIMTLEAEKEQYELTTKSLENKVKVSQVYEKDVEALREQVNYLQQQLAGKKTESGEPLTIVKTETPKEVIEELERLKAIESEHNTLMSSLGELEKHMDSVQKEMSVKDDEIQRLKEQLNQTAADKHDASNEEIQRLNNRLTSTQAELEMALKAVEAAEQRAQKAESALKESEQALNEARAANDRQTAQSQPKGRGLAVDDDILSGTDWTITNPVRRPRKPAQPKKDRNDDGELSLW